MDRARIEKKAELYVNEHGLTDAGDLADFAEHIAAIARDDALEEAAKVCDATENDARFRLQDDGKAGTAWVCAAEIRALTKYRDNDKEYLESGADDIKCVINEIKAALAQPGTGGMTATDISDDDALRFVQRVLESDAPESDRLAARDMIVGIRTRVNPERKPLSENEIKKIIANRFNGDELMFFEASLIELSQLIEAAVWEKMGCK
jgi:hypothetical protein